MPSAGDDDPAVDTVGGLRDMVMSLLVLLPPKSDPRFQVLTFSVLVVGTHATTALNGLTMLVESSNSRPQCMIVSIGARACDVADHFVAVVVS